MLSNIIERKSTVNLTKEIKELLAEHVEELKGMNITDDMMLISSGYIDSFDIINLVAIIENKYMIEIPLAEIDLESFDTVSNIVILIEGLQQKEPRNCITYPAADLLSRLSLLANTINAIPSQNRSLSQLYNAIWSENKDKVFCTYGSSDGKFEMTYSDYEQVIDRVANNLSSILSLQASGTWVALKLANHPLWLAIMWGILKAGYNVLLMDSSWERDTWEYLMEQAGTKIMVTDEKATTSEYCTIDFSELLAAKSPRSEFGNAFANAIAFCTSGTTATSKIFVFTGQEIWAQILNELPVLGDLQDILLPEGENRIMVTLPLHHTFGFNVPLLISLAGFTLVFPPDSSLSTIMKSMKENKVLATYSVPMFWDALLRLIKGKSKSETPSADMIREFLGETYRIGICGGSHISSEINSLMNQDDLLFINGYAMTETGIISLNSGLSLEQRLSNTVGYKLPLIELALLTEEEKIASTGQGELLISGPTLHRYTMEKGQMIPTRLFKESWLRTGDIFTFDQKVMHILGRQKEIIVNSSGENIYPDEIEDYFTPLSRYCQHFSVLGISDTNLNDITTLVMHLRGEYDDPIWQSMFLGKEICNINDDLPINKKVKQVYVSNKPLPMSATMKIQRNLLRKSIQENPEAFKKIAISKSTNNEALKTFTDVNELKDTLKQHLAEIMNIPEKEIRDNMNLINDLGVDSIVIAELYVILESKYDLNVSHLFKLGRDYSLEEMSQEIVALIA